jgi:hypothetical protein
MRTVLLFVPFLAVGCIREPVPAETPPRPSVAAAGYHWPPQVEFGQPADMVGPSAPEAVAAPVSFSPSPAQPAQSTEAGRVPHVPKVAAPAGEVCLGQLAGAGVSFARVDARKGVQTPVVVSGPIGGVRYVAGAGLPLELDCRMALTLAEVAPIMTALNISDLRFSGAYVYRTSRVGRLSLHAHGLALDVHAVRADGAWREVKTDFARGLGDGCADSAPMLNRLACELKRTGRFKEMLTPDYNADHHDHLHWGVAPLPEATSGPAPNAGGRNLTRP